MSTGLAVGRGHHLNKGITIGFIILFATILFSTFSGDSPGSRFIKDFIFKKTIYIDGDMFRVWVAKTEIEKEKSLNDRSEIPTNGGMLFVFDSDGLYGVSTARMQFPIDVIWISKDGEVVSTEVDVSPGRGYMARTTVPARYVLLVNAGTVEKSHIDKESRVNIPNIQ